MKLSRSEKLVLGILAEDPLINNKDISKRLKLTPQGIGKIRKQLIAKGIIKNCELALDYEKLGVNIHAIAMVKILPGAVKKYKSNKLDKVLKSKNAIRSYSIPETDITHIIIYAFRNINEYELYFRNILKDFGEYVEIKHTFVFSSGNVLKSSSKDMLLDVLNSPKN